MADEKKGGRKPDEGGKSGRSDKSRQPTAEGARARDATGSPGAMTAATANSMAADRHTNGGPACARP